MACDASGVRLREGDRVVLEAIVEEVFSIADASSVEIRLLVPPGQYAPQFVVEGAALKKVEVAP